MSRNSLSEAGAKSEGEVTLQISVKNIQYSKIADIAHTDFMTRTYSTVK